VATPRFHVQVGSFDERQNAAALALRLKSLGYAVTLVEGPPYRVWVGGYLDRDTAQRLAGNLEQAGFPAVLTSQ
jgi:cell division protein FtsN